MVSGSLIKVLYQKVSCSSVVMKLAHPRSISIETVNIYYRKQEQYINSDELDSSSALNNDGWDGRHTREEVLHNLKTFSRVWEAV